jgi:aryl-alcohol dehydrogenase-like predicted oxidoreductase
VAKIGLGTAQLGLPYGNKAKMELMSLTDAAEIVDVALNHKVAFFDTAIGYGQSEERLGLLNVKERSPSTVLATKIPAVEKGIWSDQGLFLEWVSNHILESLKRLKITRHELLQFHQCEVEFLTHPSVKYVFGRLLEMPEVQSIGVSVYFMGQALAALDTKFVTWLQVPVNIVDRRFLADDFLSLVKSTGIKLIARSSFLQGILVPQADLPPVKRIGELQELKSLALSACQQMGTPLSLDEVALQFLFSNHADNVDVILIGVDSAEALRHNLAIINRAKAPLSVRDLALFDRAMNFAAERELFNPGNWNK